MKIVYVARTMQSIVNNAGPAVGHAPGAIYITDLGTAEWALKGLGLGWIIILCPNWQHIFTNCQNGEKERFMQEMAILQQKGVLVTKFVEFM